MERMKELIVLLNKAAYAYYQQDKEIMSDHEYDTLYDELLQLEKQTNTVLANSPTQKVGYTILSNLKKIKALDTIGGAIEIQYNENGMSKTELLVEKQ